MFEDKEFPLKTVYQFSKRVSLYKDGVKMKNSGMIAYAWYVWEKGLLRKTYNRMDIVVLLTTFLNMV